MSLRLSLRLDFSLLLTTNMRKKITLFIVSNNEQKRDNDITLDKNTKNLFAIINNDQALSLFFCFFNRYDIVPLYSMVVTVNKVMVKKFLLNLTIGSYIKTLIMRIKNY